MEDRVEALKHEASLWKAKAQDAEINSEHLEAARGQVQVLTLAVASMGSRLRDTGQLYPFAQLL